MFSLGSLGHLYENTYFVKNAAIAILRLSLSNPTRTRPLPQKTDSGNRGPCSAPSRPPPHNPSALTSCGNVLQGVLLDVLAARDHRFGWPVPFEVAPGVS